MRLFLMGYPGDLGGACTEAWHTIKLWRRCGLDVHLIPTWHADPQWRARLDALGFVTHESSPERLENIPGLAGAIVVSFCNGQFLASAPALRKLGCRLAWANCMTWLFPAELEFCRRHGPFDAYIFQSQFQRSMLEPQLAQFGYEPSQGHLIRGAFDWEEWEYRPRAHSASEPFVVGRAARPDLDKWSSNTWPIYNRIQFRNKQALMLGIDERTRKKLGPPPAWAECLSPRAITAKEFFSRLHCLLPINGGARENWPRAGLEAMAAGVPVVAQNAWGWREMIVHGETGFLGSSDEELAHYAAVLAYDEPLRQRIARQARERLETDLAEPGKLGAAWQQLFEFLASASRRAA